MEQVLYHDGPFDNDEVYVYLRRGITMGQAEAAYCSLVRSSSDDLAISCGSTVVRAR